MYNIQDCIPGYIAPSEHLVTHLLKGVFMTKLIIALAVFLAASSASAQSRRSLKDIDRELKQTKSTATAMALIESIGETVPQTDEEIATLGQLMDKYPVQGQKALTKIKDPKRANAIMRECDRQVFKFKADKDKDWKTLPEAQRREKFNALLNTHAMIATLGNLKNKDALPFLKQYITSEYDGVLSYEASQAVGRIAPDDPAVFKELWDKQGVKNISYNAYGKSVLKEVAEKLQDLNVPQAEKSRILAKAKPSLLGGREPEEKKLIKEILLHHPNEDLRKEVGIAMIHAIQNRQDSDDSEFILEWAKNVKVRDSGWAIYCMKNRWDNKYVPSLIRFIKEGISVADRSEAAKTLGGYKIKESVPYLEECLEKDKDGGVRGACRDSYYKITGRMPEKFHPDDVKDIEEQLVAPYAIKFYSKLKENDPDKIYHNALVNALNEYKKTQSAKGEK